MIASFLFLGPTGVGKTHLALAIAGNRIKNNLSVYFCFMPNLLDKLRKSFEESDPSLKIDFDDLINSPFLILDDLGSENSSNWASEKIYQIICFQIIFVVRNRDFFALMLFYYNIFWRSKILL